VTKNAFTALLCCFSNICKHGDVLITVNLLIYFVLLLFSLLRYIFSTWYFVSDTMLTRALRYKLSCLSTVGNCVYFKLTYVDGRWKDRFMLPVDAHVINKAMLFVNTKAKILGTFEKFRQVKISFVISVCPFVHKELLSFQWTDLHDFYIAVFFVIPWRKHKFH
jgi:hypothetical protein